MKCSKCGRPWDVSSNITSTTYVCPYCGEIMDVNGRSKKNLGEVIETIIAEFGEDVLEDPTRLNAMLMDYAPDMTKERKLVINALKEGILTQIKRELERNEKIENVAKKCTAMLVSDMWITEKAAFYAVNVIMRSLGHSLIGEQKAPPKPEANTERILIKGASSFGAVVRKEELLNYSAIGYKAFAANYQLTEIEVPKNIIRIYPKAFFGCSSLKKISLSSTLEEIGQGAFDGCIQLENIIIDNNKNYVVSNGCLIDKGKRLLIKSIDKAGDVSSIINGIKTVCKKSFERIRVQEIKIPATVSKIEEDAFYFTMNLQNIAVDPANKDFRSIDGVLHSRDVNKLLKYPQGRANSSYYLEDEVVKIGKKAFSYALKLRSVTFAGNLKEIGERAFEYCVGIENILLPRSVEIIGEMAFQYCENLFSVMLPQGIIRIGDGAFLGCKKLKTLSIPRSVEEIGGMAFAGCKELSKVVIQENVKFIDNNAFKDCPNVEISVKANDYVATYCKVHGIRLSQE